jgi:hypothetical protein
LVKWSGALLSVLLFSCSAETESEQGQTSEAPAAAPAPRTLDDFKARYAAEDVRRDDTLQRTYGDLLAKEQGLEPEWRTRRFDRRLAEDARLSGALSARQAAAWRTLTSLAAGAVVSWDEASKTPAYAELGLVFRGDTGIAAHADFDARVGALVGALFERGSDELVPTAEEPVEVPMGFGDEPPLRAHRFRYDRLHDGLPVFGDWYTVTLQTISADAHSWHATVASRWTRDLPRLGLTKVSEADAVSAARASGEVADGVSLRTVRLGYHVANDSAELAYEILLGNDTGMWLYYVSAITGAVLEKSDQIARAPIGTLKANVLRPYEAAPVARALPFANIYENFSNQTGTVGCGYGGSPPTQRLGNPAERKGATLFNGAYTNLIDFNAADTTWTIDLRGPHAKDISANYSQLDFGNFTAGGNFTFPSQTSNVQNRRTEVFYLLNYGWNAYRAYGLDQYEPLGFTYFSFAATPATVDPDCSAPASLTDCCGGYTKAGCVYVECGMGATGAALAEKRMREVTLHEQQHSLRFKAAGNLCSSCSGSSTLDGPECNCWEEGRAMFGAIALGRLEKARPEDRPNKKYPADFVLLDGLAYNPGSIWSAIYTHYLFEAGPSAIGDVGSNLNQVDTNTRMVGNCTSSTDYTTCPANSFYRQLIASQQALSTPAWRNTAEISQVFHEHVTDANRAVAGSQAFPWADETPNRFLTAPFVFTDRPAQTQYNVTNGPDNDNLSLALNSADDNDTFSFLVHAGETYTVSTSNLATSVDTQLEIFKFSSSNQTQIAFNDDCNPPNRSSCVSFTATETAFYRARVNSYPGAVTGPTATYFFSVQTSGDDYGDGFGDYAPLPPDNLMRTMGTLETSSDADMFGLIVPTAPQDLNFVGCSSNGSFSVRLELYNPSGTLVDAINNVSCFSPVRTITLSTAGFWSIRVISAGGGTGSGTYGMRIGLSKPDIDVNNKMVNAYAISSNSLLGTLFETTTDSDWFKISAVAGQFYTVETLALDVGATRVNSKIEVYAPKTTMYGPTGTSDQMPDTSGESFGHWMLSNSDGGLGQWNARVTFWAAVTGDYYIRVLPEAGSVAGRYALMTSNNSAFSQTPPALP